MSVTDERTGKTYELEITDGTIKAPDLRQIKVSDDDFGLMAYDPAFLNTASCRSAITWIDGDKGELWHRRNPDRAALRAETYLEVAYLLIYRGAADAGRARAVDPRHHSSTPSFTRTSRSSSRASGTTLTRWACCSRPWARFRPSIPDAKHIDDREERYMATIRMIAKMPTLAAFAYRHNRGLPYVYPDNDLDYPSNFLSMMFKMTELRYEADPSLARALDVLWILHADHEQNCSTNAVRASARHRSIRTRQWRPAWRRSTGRCTAARTRPSCKMLERIGSVENIPDFLQGVKDRKELLMGFGHRVYKNYDPRARIIKKHVDEVLEVTGTNPKLEIAVELEKRALDDEFFTSRKLYPNVDFYSGLIYEALSLPTAMFTVMFAIPRTSGWMSQWLEMVDDSEQKIARPRQIYTGGGPRDYVPIDKR